MMESGRPGVPGLIPRTQHQHQGMNMGGGGGAGGGGGGRHSLPLPGSSSQNQMRMLVPRRPPTGSGSGSSGSGGKLMRLRCRFRPLHDTYVKGGCSIDESADVIFLCGDGHQVKAHKVILASSSKFFANMFEGQPVGEITVVNVPDVRVDILKLILQLTYRDRVIIDAQQLQDVGDYLGMFGLAWGQFVYEDYNGDEPQTSVAKSPIPIKPVELPRKIIYVQRNPAGSPQGQQQGVRQVATTGNSNERERLPLQQVSNGTADPNDHQQQLQQAQAERHSRKSKLTTRAGIEGEDIVEQEGEDDPDNLTRDWMSRLGKKESPPSTNMVTMVTQNAGGAQPIKRMRTSEDQLPQQQKEENICSICNTRFQTEVAWLWHEERHVGANMFKCKFCDHLAKTPKLCYVHEKQDHGYSGLHHASSTGTQNQQQQQNVSANSGVNANSNGNTATTHPQQRVVIRTPAPTQTTRPIQISQQIKKRVQMANLNLKKFQAQKQLAAVKHSQFGIGESTGLESLDNKKVKQLHWLYVCEKCNNCADSSTKAANHYEQCYPDKEKEFVNTVTKYRQGFYGTSMCPLCPRHYPHNNGYMIHCGHHHPQYRRLCTLTGSGNDEQLKCNNCKECFADPTAFHEHLQVGPGQGQFYCDEEPIEEPNDEPPKLTPKEKPPPAPAAKPRGPGRPPNTGGKPRIKRPESPMESKASYKVQFHTPPRSARLASRVQAEASAEAAAAAAKVKPQPEDDKFPPVDCPVCGDSDLPNISLHLETKHKDLNVNVQRISAELLRCKGCTITFDICDLLDHKNCLQETESPGETEAESDASSRRSSTGIGRPPVKAVIVDAESLPPGIGRSPIERIEIDDLHSIEAIRSALKCLICGQTARRLGVIAECLRSHGVHRCALCFNSYISKTDYGQHLRKCHGSGSNKLKCPLCPKAFANAGQTSGHMYSTHWLQILKENELALANESVDVENENKSDAGNKTNGGDSGEGSENKGKEIAKTENDSKSGTEQEADELMDVSGEGSEMVIDESAGEELANDEDAEVVAGNVLNNSDQDLKSDE